jgi:DNA modification methylase
MYGAGSQQLAASGKKPVHVAHGLKTKDLVGITWRVAFALQEDGWFLRSEIIWHKPNPMPESVSDGPTRSHETVFLLAKSARYFFDAVAVAETARTSFDSQKKEPSLGKAYGLARSKGDEKSADRDGGFNPSLNGTRNIRTVWIIPTKPLHKAHFAVFPWELARRCVVAGSKAGDLVLDPFAGSGTVGAVAIAKGRRFVGCELNPEFADMAEERIGATARVLAEQGAA